MSDRHIAYTVTLLQPLKDEDSERVIEAIKMLRFVAAVVPVVMDPQTYWARDTARRELLTQLFGLLKETQ